jgi:hypothetical protein
MRAHGGHGSPIESAWAPETRAAVRGVDEANRRTDGIAGPVAHLEARHVAPVLRWVIAGRQASPGPTGTDIVARLGDVLMTCRAAWARCSDPLDGRSFINHTTFNKI